MPVAGLVSDRLGTRKIILLASMLVMAVLMALPVRIGESWQILAFLIGIGLASGAAGAMTIAAAPEEIFVGPTLFGWVLDTAGWDAAALSLVPIMVLGTLAAWWVKVR